VRIRHTLHLSLSVAIMGNVTMFCSLLTETQISLLAAKALPDLPLNFHPAGIRASAGFMPWGAGGATCDRRSWSGLRSRSHVAERLAA
jgi:hypothetical protein